MRGIADEKCEVFLSKRSELMMNDECWFIIGRSYKDDGKWYSVSDAVEI